MRMTFNKGRAGLLAISTLFAVAMLVPMVASAHHGTNGHSGGSVSGSNGGNLDCSEGYVLLEKYDWIGQAYVLDEDSPGTNVTVTGNAVSGTFTVINTNKLVYEVIVKGSNTAKRVLYIAGVSGGTFDNSGLINDGGQTADISNIKFCGKDKPVEPEDEYFVNFAKTWDGDEVDLEGVEVVFYIGEIAWRLGDDAVEVDPGEVLSPLSEVVTGLPENCTYESDLPTSFTVPVGDDASTFTRTYDEYEEGDEVLYTLDVINTVTCTTDEDDDGEVLEDNVVAVVTPAPTTPTSLPNTGNSVATIVALMTAVSAGAAMFSTTLRSALIKFNS